MEEGSEQHRTQLKAAYKTGFLDALRALAVWKDGDQVVGVREQPLQKFLDDPSQMYNYNPDGFLKWYLGQ